MMLPDIQQLNAADRDQFVQLLGGIYEHSPWVAEQTWAARPFSSLVHLTQSLSDTVARADNNRKLELLRAHPELAGKVTPGHALTGESADEQTRAGLANCSPDELTLIRRLNTAYREKFGFPFILAVRGPRGDGLSRQEILATFERRLNNPRDFELEECLRNVNRIAQLRLNDAFHLDLEHGNLVLDWAEQLASFSESPYKERGELTVTYLTQAHRACADQLACWMREDCGFDDVHLDAVGNLVGIYRGSDPDQPRLLTGSHYDTVRNAGKYDGRLGILAPMAWVRHLHQQAKRPPFGIEVICFAEEEGQRYNATFLGSSALTGHFDPAWLMQHDLEGISMRQAMLNAGFNPDDIAALKRDPSQYLGFVEIHIEQGPVLNTAGIPLGVVTSINGSRRFTGQINGTASHAGTTPMNQRRDALVAAAELIVAVESRAASTSGTVATVGIVDVRGGSVNVVPGNVHFTLDVRAADDNTRDSLVDAIKQSLCDICKRRGMDFSLEQTMIATAAPSDAGLRSNWEQAVNSLGLPSFLLPSGAGHDAMKMGDVMPQAMLFVRGEHAGISHNPLESVSNNDAELAVAAFGRLLEILGTSR